MDLGCLQDAISRREGVGERKKTGKWQGGLRNWEGEKESPDEHETQAPHRPPTGTCLCMPSGC